MASHPPLSSMNDRSASPTTKQGKSVMDQVITGLVDGIVVPVTNGIAAAASSGLLAIVFGALWLAFAAGVIWSQGSLDDAWHWIRALPLIPQGVIWLLFLPVVAGLWVWESTWPLLMRLLIDGGLAAWSVFIFLPKTAEATTRR